MTVSCRLKHGFEYARKSAGEERKGYFPFLFSAFGMPIITG